MANSPRQEFEKDIDDVRQMHDDLVRGAGGTPGGTWIFFLGLVLAASGLWFFLSNVHVMTEPFGMVSGVLGRGFGLAGPAMSTGIVFAPIFLGLVLLFYDAKLKWGWALFYVGLAHDPDRDPEPDPLPDGHAGQQPAAHARHGRRGHRHDAPQLP